MMCSKPKALISISACFFVIPVALVTSIEATAQTDVDERIVVTATQTERPWLTTPASVDNLSSDEQLPGLRVDSAELLAGIAGLQADSRANYAQDSRIVLRGFGARSAFGVRGVLLSLDGVPLSMPDGQAQTSSILLDEAANVEVLRGPLAALYGNGAGGFVEWRSQAPQQSQLHATTMFGSDDTSRALVQGDWVSDSGDQAARITHAKFRTDGAREQNRAKRDQIALRWYQNFANNLRLVLRYDDNDAPLLEDPGALTPTAWREDSEQTFGGAATFNTRKFIRHRQGSASLQHDSAEQQWQLTAWQGQREVVQFLPFPGDDPGSSGAVIDLTREFQGVNGRYTRSLAETLAVTVGADIEQQEDNRLGFVNDFGQTGDLRRDETGTVDKQDVYVITDWQLAPKWQLVAGARYSELEFDVADRYITAENPDDSGQRNDDELAWSFGLTYQVNPDFALFSAYGESFATPTLTELAYRNEGTGLNTALTPSTDEQIEVGFKWRQQEGFTLSGSLFAINTDDELLVDQSNDGRTTYRNASETERLGVELSGQWQHSASLSSRFAFTQLSAEFGPTTNPTETTPDLDGQRLPGVAETSAFWQLDWQLPWSLFSANQSSPLTFSLVTDYRSDIAATDDNAVIAPSRTVYHAALSSEWQLPQWTIASWLRVDNLTDKKYVGSVVVNQGSGRAFEPATGRGASLGISLTRRF